MMKIIKKLSFLFLGIALYTSCSKNECIEKPCNDGVPMSYIPVCGCNNVTYPNKETAECFGIIRYRNGECDE